MVDIEYEPPLYFKIKNKPLCAVVDPFVLVSHHYVKNCLKVYCGGVTLDLLKIIQVNQRINILISVPRHSIDKTKV